MAAYRTRLLAFLALVLCTLAVAQAFTEEECAAKLDSERCTRESLAFCERWVCEQNVNRKFRICVESGDNYGPFKSACDAQQRENPTLRLCTVTGILFDVGIWYNKDWCNRTENPENYATITPTVHAESDTLDIIIENRTQSAVGVINAGQATCAGGVPTGDFEGLPACICAAVVPASCVREVRTDVIATNPDQFPAPLFNETMAEILVTEFNFTPEEAGDAANQSECQRFPELDECQRPSPAPARRLFQPIQVEMPSRAMLRQG